MKKIKLCLVTDTWFPIIGGGPQVVLNYTKRLTSKYQVDIHILTRKFPQTKKIFSKSDNSRIKIIRLNAFGSWDNIFGRLVFIVQAFFYLLSNNYDLIHAFPFIAGIPAYLAGKIKKTPVVFSVFALRSLNRDDKTRDLGIILEDYLCLKIPYEAVITDNKYFYQKYSHKKRKIFYIPNGVNVGFFDKIKADKQSFPALLYVGRFHKQKGLTVLLRALKPLLVKYPNLTLTLVGWGPEEGKISQFIQNNNLKSAVFLKKPLYDKDLIKQYKESHLFVLPSYYEGQGIVILESWAARLPVIVSDFKGQSLVKNGVNGYLARPGSSQSLTEVIERALSDHKLKALGNNGYRLVNKNYRWEQVVDKVYKVYLSLLKNKND